MPKTLDETYNRVLQNLDANGQLPDAIKALQWLCYSDGPLELSELVDILAIETGEEGDFDPEERLPDPADIVTICSSLVNCETEVAVNPLVNTRAFRGSSWVRLAHFSVKEFLLSDRCAFRSAFQPLECHQQIAKPVFATCCT